MQKTIEDFRPSEKRGLARFRVHYLADIYLGDEIICSTVVDISESGIGIVVPHRLYPEEALSLRIFCPLRESLGEVSSKIEVPFRAKVMWVREEKEKRMYRSGLSITDISPDSIRNLSRHIRRMMSVASESSNSSENAAASLHADGEHFFQVVAGEHPECDQGF